MKVLTLHQPWASLVALGVKTIETRSWSTKYRGPLAIHAAARPLGNGALNVGTWTNITGEPIAQGEQMMSGGWDRLLVCPLGAIVATCTLVDVVPMTRSVNADHTFADFLDLEYEGWDLAFLTLFHERCSVQDFTDQRPYGDYSPGRFAWLLADVVPVDPPAPFKGGQGLTKTWEPAAVSA